MRWADGSVDMEGEECDGLGARLAGCVNCSCETSECTLNLRVGNVGCWRSYE